MKVLLNAIDSGTTHGGPFPNLAIMKISAYHKAQGHTVALIGRAIENPDRMTRPDRVYVSCVFTWNATEAKLFKTVHPEAEFYLGGSGIDYDNLLPLEIADLDPDYEIYNNRGVPGWPFAVGFSTRGCNRKCPFCIVPQKEGRISQETELDRLVGDCKRLILLDNNFVQDEMAAEKLRWLVDRKIEVNYSQGIDARVIANRLDLAQLLYQTKFRSRSFKSPQITLAYDLPQYSKVVTKSVEVLKDAGFDVRCQVKFFVLCNWSTTFKEDLGRAEHLRNLGTMPYIMIYDKPNAPYKVKALQRWCNVPALFWSTSWDEYWDGKKHLDDTRLRESQMGLSW